MATWEDVVEIGLRLPKVEVGTSYATAALRVRGKGLCRLRAGPEALVQTLAPSSPQARPTLTASHDQHLSLIHI